MATVATTRNGPVEGRQEGGAADRPVQVFRGIPFAQPPIGDLRFCAPRPASSWNGVLDATDYGPIPVQQRGGVQVKWWGLEGEMGEDCLTLNVWTPAVDAARRPVMVWIYGGSFVVGAAKRPATEGLELARRGDVVVVSMNYRVGALGWLQLDELGGEASSGNNGLLDQIAALEWVRDNIEAFGGDPANVTLFGESAGAISVAALMHVGRAKGLFHKAILQSGGPSIVRTQEQARAMTTQFLELAGVGDLDGLRALSPSAIIGAQARLRGRGAEQIFAPLVDGEILAVEPMEEVGQGVGGDIPVLSGTNLDEFRFWLETDRRLPTLRPRHLHKRIVRNGADPGAVIAAYQRSRPHLDDNQLAIALVGDMSFRLPQIRMAEARARHGADTWMYLMTRPSPVEGGRFGCAHAMDIPFVFGNLDVPNVHRFIGDGTERVRLSETMQNAWLGFARHGDPTHEELPEWPTYALGERSTVLFDVPSVLASDPYAGERIAWGEAPFTIQV